MIEKDDVLPCDVSSHVIMLFMYVCTYLFSL